MTHLIIITSIYVYYTTLVLCAEYLVILYHSHDYRLNHPTRNSNAVKQIISDPNRRSGSRIEVAQMM